jgi:Spy/CpxP family protein refolding chaperone
VLGLFAGFAATQPGSLARLEEPSAALAELGLDAEQEQRIAALRSREAGRVEALRRALAEAEDELRRAELARPFDAERVNELVGRQAELIAFLRGTESRVVAGIAALLAPEQQRRFAELRTEGAGSEPREHALPAPEEAFAPRASGI